MKKILTNLIVFAFLGMSINAQPTITNAENFTIGTILTIQDCYIANVYAGDSGANIIWNFGTLTSGGTTTEQMVTPQSTTHGNLFPTSTLVEKYSNGTFVYAITNADSSMLVGYVDTVNNYIQRYSYAMLFAMRPITYGNIFTRNYADSFASSSYNYFGAGTVTVNGDGYGTLILPTGTFNNVLRIKITENELDSLLPSGSGTSSASTTSWVWFDGIHTSALLKIDSTHSGTFTSKTVEYLSSETYADIVVLDNETNISIYPNPTTKLLNIHSQLTMDNCQLIVTDIMGNEVYHELLPSNVNCQLSIANWSAELYFYELRSNTDIARGKFIVN
jgi:hypothetical protein